MTNLQKGEKLIELVGGKDNIISATNCMTRCRFILKDYSLVKEKELNDEDFVLGTQNVSDQFQVIVGPGNAAKIMMEINENNLLNEQDLQEEYTNEWQENKEKYKKKNVVGEFLKKIGAIFLPMIPGFIAAGLLLGFANIMSKSEIKETEEFEVDIVNQEMTITEVQEMGSTVTISEEVAGQYLIEGDIIYEMPEGYVASEDGLSVDYNTEIVDGQISTSEQSTQLVKVEPTNDIISVGSNLSSLYYFFFALGMALYGSLIIFTGINTAKVFGGTEILGGIIGAFILSSSLTDIVLGLFSNPSEEVVAFATGLPGDGGVFGVIFAVMFMSFVEKRIRKIMPGMIELIFTPLLTLLIAGIATIGFMVVAAQLTEIIGWVLENLVQAQGILGVISGALIGGLFLPLVTLGLHQGLTPIYIEEILTNGATYIFPIAAMAGAGQVGASAAIWYKAKQVDDKKMQKVISGAIVPGMLGVGEPLIYGVTLPLGKPFITAGLGAAVGGAYIAVAQVGAVATGPSGLTAIPLILPEDITQYIIGILISYIMGFIFTFFFYKYEKQKMN